MNLQQYPSTHVSDLQSNFTSAQNIEIEVNKQRCLTCSEKIQTWMGLIRIRADLDQSLHPGADLHGARLQTAEASGIQLITGQKQLCT
jgi:hypothetical protein